MKLGKKKNAPEAAEEKNEDFLAQEAKEMEEQAPEYTLDIPEDEIWTYQIEGLQAPKIGQSYDGAKLMKTVVVVVILIAISLSIFFSVLALRNKEYRLTEIEGGYELTTYTNPGSVREVKLDYVDGDKNKPITALHDYAFNCDGAIEKIYLGKDVKEFNAKSIYSCWNIQYVDVDDENPYFCDVDGVVYSKDMTKLVFFPTDYDRTLRLKNGYAHLVWECEVCGRQYDPEKGDAEMNIAPGTLPTEFPKDFHCIGKDGKPCNSKENSYYQAYHSDIKDKDGNELWELIWDIPEEFQGDYYEEYNLKTRTYVIPSTVTEITQLSLAYSNNTELYIPEGVKIIGNQGIFKNEHLRHIYSYKPSAPVTKSFYQTQDELKKAVGTVYNSLPEGLEEIGSDAIYWNRSLDYMYIPSSVKKIGHHCFWDSMYKDNGEVFGLKVINVALDEESFKNNCELGESWLPEYNNGLFNKKAEVKYAAQRE